MVTDMSEPFCVFYNAVKLVTVEDPVSLAVDSSIDCFISKFDAGHVMAFKPTKAFIMIAGYIDNLGSVFGHFKKPGE